LSNWIAAQRHAVTSWYKEARMDLWWPAILWSLWQIMGPILLVLVFTWSEEGHTLKVGEYENRLIGKGFVGYLILCGSVIMSGGAMKAAIESTKETKRLPVIAAVLLLAAYLLGGSVWFAVAKPLRDLPITASTVVVFYFVLYALFAGWTVKPVWDLLTDARKDVILNKKKLG
jgi:hypothetical protein